MITDIQGKWCKYSGKYDYFLSDPVLTSQLAGSFGPTDLGATAMNAFFSEHKCNHICEGLKRPDGVIEEMPLPDLIGEESTKTMTIQ